MFGRANRPLGIALIDVDGLLLNQNFGSLYSVGDNPLASFRDKLEAAAHDPRTVAVVLRINSPGGSVTACDIMAEELRRFRVETHKPVVASLMDLATSGAYFIAVESDRIVAHPTSLTGGLGVVFNHFNLQDAMAQLNLVANPVKAGSKIDMGTVTAPLDEETRKLFQQIADAYRDHLQRRVKERRAEMTCPRPPSRAGWSSPSGFSSSGSPLGRSARLPARSNHRGRTARGHRRRRSRAQSPHGLPGAFGLRDHPVTGSLDGSHPVQLPWARSFQAAGISLLMATRSNLATPGRTLMEVDPWNGREPAAIRVAGAGNRRRWFRGRARGP